MADIQLIKGAANGNPSDSLPIMYDKVNKNTANINTQVVNHEGRLGTAEAAVSNHGSRIAENETELVSQDHRINNLVANAGDSNAEIVDARQPESGVPYATVGKRLNKVDEQLAEIAINVKMFGAVGDGVTDDTEAFRSANLYGYERARTSTPQLVPTASMQIYIPSGVYRLKGHRIFGSPVPDGIVGNEIPQVVFKVAGDNATIIWDLNTVNDELFYFDGTIDAPKISGLNIFVVSENNTIPIGGTIFRYSTDTTLGYSGASKSVYDGITVWSGRSIANTSYSTRPKYVFKLTGNSMADQAAVINSRFNYFETCFRCENQESVNWTFDSCSFYGGGWGTSIYFDFTKMGDNFNVNNCSFSMNQNETLLKTNSPLSGGFYTQGALYNFNFDSNRIEIYGTSGNTWKLCDMNFGRFNMKNSNLRLASGAANVKTIVSTYGLANVNFENVAFNNTLFLLPIATAASLTGGLSSMGAMFHYCDLLSTLHEIKYYDGVTQYSIKEALTGAGIFRTVRFEDCTYANGNGTIDYDISNNQSAVGTMKRIERTLNFSKGGIALGTTFSLPPFQTIKNIKIFVSTLPSTYDKFRVYFGDKTLGNYIDVANPNAGGDIKSEFLLWEGIATIYYTDISLQSITVYVLNSGVETGSIRSQISVTCEPLDPLTFGLNTTADSIQIRTKVQNTSYGTTAIRPTIGLYINKQYFDTTLGKPIWWNGTVWKDAAGTTV
ncbi:hypothetical protein MHB77_29450 [Paenibacillus sp. FSL K6-3166]|uniref:hypothetical protein n=1 Tax=unclassified Paenibacillus TaxID=185978 RepID=UPI000B9F9AC2|nr:hypothetical protein [Paenibacillus sp. VTT E-133291]OZQ95852.1 hypothetical protein CA598_08465 [Paenibacillus sp. VTT E-133291]